MCSGRERDDETDVKLDPKIPRDLLPMTSKLLHIVVWVVLAALVYTYAATFSLAACWFIIVLLLLIEYFAFIGIGIVLIVFLFATVFKKYAKIFGRIHYAAHIAILICGLAACFFATFPAADSHRCVI